eukprot:3869071-Rhodomonas_salina.2
MARWRCGFRQPCSVWCHAIEHFFVCVPFAEHRSADMEGVGVILEQDQGERPNTGSESDADSAREEMGETVHRTHVQGAIIFCEARQQKILTICSTVRSRVQDIADSCGELLSFSLRLQPRSKSQFLFVLSRFLSNSQLLFDVRNPQLSHAPVVNATTHVLLSPPHSPPCLATRGEHFVRRERREEEEGHGHRGRRGHRRPEEGVHGLFNPEQLRKVVVPGTSIRAHQYHTLPYYRTWPTPIS